MPVRFPVIKRNKNETKDNRKEQQDVNWLRGNPIDGPSPFFPTPARGASHFQNVIVLPFVLPLLPHSPAVHPIQIPAQVKLFHFHGPYEPKVTYRVVVQRKIKISRGDWMACNESQWKSLFPNGNNNNSKTR